MSDNIGNYEYEEFLPPDAEQVDWLTDLASQLRLYAQDPRFTFNEQNILNVSSRQIFRLLSMCLAGFHLYSEWRSAALNLLGDVDRALLFNALNGGSLNESDFPGADACRQLVFISIEEEES